MGKKIEKWVGATGRSYNFQITLPIVRTVSSLNHRQTLFQLKTQAVFKFPVVCNFFSPKISTNKKPFCYDSGKCWAVNVKNWEDFLLNPPLSNAARHSCSAIRANILTSFQGFFVFKQPNSKIPCPQSPLVSRPRRLRDEKRLGTRMVREWVSRLLASSRVRRATRIWQGRSCLSIDVETAVLIFLYVYNILIKNRIEGDDIVLRGPKDGI